MELFYASQKRKPNTFLSALDLHEKVLKITTFQLLRNDFMVIAFVSQFWILLGIASKTEMRGTH